VTPTEGQTMTTIHPRPPFDPELEAVLAVLAEQLPPTLTSDMIPLLRLASPTSISPEAMLPRSRDHAPRCDDSQP
jgi:hypothetical protein